MARTQDLSRAVSLLHAAYRAMDLAGRNAVSLHDRAGVSEVKQAILDAELALTELEVRS